MNPSPLSDQIVGNSSAIQAVYDLIDRVAQTAATVLITGESGTGKELVAREIHKRSDRSDHSLVVVNCAAIPANLLEAELFGYEKGAFTDARITKKGLFEIADGSTIFLDEIGLMPLELQAKILTTIETQTFRHLGDVKDIYSDARIIAATNENLEESVRSGQFRQDLYYRLSVVPLHLPPLRERESDILQIAQHFLSIYGPRYKRETLTLSATAQRWLQNYAWPGNVRELRNAIERAVLLCRGNEITLEDLALGKDEADLLATTQTTLQIDPVGNIEINLPPWGLALEDVERRLILAALEQSSGNISAAAQLLHISRDTLRYRLKKHNIDPDNLG